MVNLDVYEDNVELKTITPCVPTFDTRELSPIPTGSSDYNDLDNKPSIEGVTLEGNVTLEELGAFSGDYNDLSNKPNLFSGDYDDLSNKPNLATVATSGSYTDLTNKPSINGHTLEGDKTAEELGIISQADLIDFGHTLAPVITDTAQGDIVSITDGAEDYPIKSLKVNLEPIQEGSGDPSPTNIRPISGWSGVEVNRTGVNIWDEEWEVGGLTWAGGAPYPGNDRIRSKNFCKCLPNTTYYGNTNVAIFFYDSNEDFINYVGVFASTFTTPSNACYFKVLKEGTTTYNHDICINYPSTVHEYHPYNGESKSIPFKDSEDNPITVYGGEIDVVKGEGESKMSMVDLGTLNWTSGSDSRHTVFFARFDGLKYVTDNVVVNAISSQYKAITKVAWSGADIDTDYVFRSDNSAEILYFRNLAYTDPTAFKTAMDGVQLCYELATPTDFNTTPTPLNTYKGNNTLWSDGDIEVEYCCDTKLYIEKKLNE